MENGGDLEHFTDGQAGKDRDITKSIGNVHR